MSSVTVRRNDKNQNQNEVADANPEYQKEQNEQEKALKTNWSRILLTYSS